MADAPQDGGVPSLLQSKLVKFLFVLALLLGIVTEGITLFRQVYGARTDVVTLDKTKGETKQVTAQGDQAPIREPAITEGAVADAEIKKEQAKQAARKMKAEADEAEARACKARVDSDAANMRVDMTTGKIIGEDRKVIVQPFDHCDPAHRFDVDLSEKCKADLEKILTENTYKAGGAKGYLIGLLLVKGWKATCNNHVEQAQEPELTEMFDAWQEVNKGALDAAAKVTPTAPAVPAVVVPTDAAPANAAPLPATPVAPVVIPAPAPTPPPAQVAIVAPAAPPAAPQPKLVENYDFEGGDVGDWVKDISWEDCQAQCKTVAGCIAVSYDKWKQACFFKSEVRPAYLNPRSVSMIFNGADWKTANAPQHIPIRHGCVYEFAKDDVIWRQAEGDFASCVSKCQSDESCVAVSRSQVAKICFGLKAVSGRVANPDMDCAGKFQETPQ